MSFGNAFRTAQLNLILNGIQDTIMEGIADNDASPETELYVHLHTASPGVGGSSSTNEAAYAGYARQPIDRIPGDPFWSVTDGVATPGDEIIFPAASSGNEDETHASICKDDGSLIAFALLVPGINIAVGKPGKILTTTQFVLV